VPGSEAALAARHLQRNILTKFSVLAQLRARRLIEFAHIVIGVREDDPAVVRTCLSVLIPALDQLILCCTTRLGAVHMSGLIIGGERLTGSPRGQLPCRIALPVHLLPSHFGNL